jgi:hypothetical protein
MVHFFLKLIPPRPTFAQDLTQAEAKLMQAHAVYWRRLLEARVAIVYGLVGDPGGAYGIGVVELDDAGDPEALAAGDPTIKANVGFRYEISPMPRAVARP